jgi:hypothetical protein
MLNADTPKSKKKVSTLVSTMFIPVLMWAITTPIFICCVLGYPLAIAIVASIFASTLIFLIERSIINSDGNFWQVSFRVLLGITFGLLGTLIIDEVIFKDDINQQMTLNKSELLQEQKNKVHLEFKDDINRQEQLVVSKNVIWNNALENVSKEAGGEGGSGIPGVNSITKLKIAIAQQNEHDYLKAKEELEVAKSKQASEIDAAISITEASFHNNALLQRVKAMFDLVQQNGPMKGAYILFTVFFFALEFMVVIFKLTWKKTNYDVKLELIEEIGLKRMNLMRDNDLKHYDVSRQYPQVKQSMTDVRKFSSTSLLN